MISISHILHTTAVTLILLFLSPINSEEEPAAAIEQIGEVFRFDSSLSPRPGWEDHTFLLGNGEITTEGVVFAITGWFLNSRSFYVQIYRLIDPSTPQTYRLVDQWLVKAEAEDLPRQQTISFYADSETCLHVEPGDRLGIHFRSSYVPVAYTFDPRSGINFHVPDEDEASPQPGRTEITFDDIPYPYQISIAALIDHDLGRYSDLRSPTCRSDIPVPSQTIQEPVSQTGLGPMGDTGPTGPDGHIGLEGPQGIQGEKGAEGQEGPRGFRGREGPTGDSGEVGPQGDTGSRGERGSHGYNGTDGSPGRHGVDGEQGATGQQGPEGHVGPPGPPAQEDNNRLAKEVGDCEWCWLLYNPYIVLTNIIWLILITITLMVLICVVTCRRSRRKPLRDILATNASTPSTFDNHYDRTITWEGSEKDLWKTYETRPHQALDEDAQSKTGYANQGVHNDDVYSSIQEGRTAF